MASVGIAESIALKTRFFPELGLSLRSRFGLATVTVSVSFTCTYSFLRLVARVYGTNRYKIRHFCTFLGWRGLLLDRACAERLSVAFAALPGVRCVPGTPNLELPIASRGGDSRAVTPPSTPEHPRGAPPQPPGSSRTRPKHPHEAIPMRPPPTQRCPGVPLHAPHAWATHGWG